MFESFDGDGDGKLTLDDIETLVKASNTPPQSTPAADSGAQLVLRGRIYAICTFLCSLPASRPSIADACSDACSTMMTSSYYFQAEFQNEGSAFTARSARSDTMVKIKARSICKAASAAWSSSEQKRRKAKHVAFVAFLGLLNANPHLLRCDAGVRSIFNQYGTGGGDGKLSKAELKAVLGHHPAQDSTRPASSSAAAEQEQLGALWESVDTDKDGVIGFGEFATFAKAEFTRPSSGLVSDNSVLSMSLCLCLWLWLWLWPWLCICVCVCVCVCACVCSRSPCVLHVCVFSLSSSPSCSQYVLEEPDGCFGSFLATLQRPYPDSLVTAPPAGWFFPVPCWLCSDVCTCAR